VESTASAARAGIRAAEALPLPAPPSSSESELREGTIWPAPSPPATALAPVPAAASGREPCSPPTLSDPTVTIAGMRRRLGEDATAEGLTDAFIRVRELAPRCIARVDPGLEARPPRPRPAAPPRTALGDRLFVAAFFLASAWCFFASPMAISARRRASAACCCCTCRLVRLFSFSCSRLRMYLQRATTQVRARTPSERKPKARTVSPPLTAPLPPAGHQHGQQAQHSCAWQRPAETRCQPVKGAAHVAVGHAPGPRFEPPQPKRERVCGWQYHRWHRRLDDASEA